MMVLENPLRVLERLGQSVWLDFIERGFVRGGGLDALIRDDGVSGVTSNPAIFQQAIADGAAYREVIDAMARDGLAAHEIHEALVIEDIRTAADVLSGVFERTHAADGYVSLEVSPHFAHDAEGTYWEAKRLWTLVSRPNLMVKVPGTTEGISAVRRLTADGINVNVTLLFSVNRYAAAAEAFVEGLADRAERNLPLNAIASVASFFLSRIDTLIDPILDKTGTQQALMLRGQCAIVCARAAYRHYQSSIESSRWQMLQADGARPQRLLWASTGTKNPAYSDVKYVEALIGPQTVATMPLETLHAYRDHGRPMRRLPGDANASELSLADLQAQLASVGTNWHAVTCELETQGIRKFITPHEATLAALRKRITALMQ